ncbi:MAG: hypothetical protein ACXVW7_01390 [Trebonia sp.]
MLRSDVLEPETVQNALGNSYFVGTGGGGQALLAIITLVTMLTLLIIAIAGLGVLNTPSPCRSARKPTTSASSRPSA